MNNKNKTNNKKHMNNVKTKTRVSSRSRVVVGLVTALVVITAIGTAIFFAGVVPPAGCQKQDDNTYICSKTEDFLNFNNIDGDSSDSQMVLKDGKLLLNPSKQISLTTKELTENDQTARLTKQICGKICAPNSSGDSDVPACIDDISLANMVDIRNLKVEKAGVQTNTMNFTGAKLGKKSDLPYKFEYEIFDQNGEGSNYSQAMVQSTNPTAAVVYNDMFGSTRLSVLPIAPDGFTTLQVNACGQKKASTQVAVDISEFDQFNPVGQVLDTSFIQGQTVSKNISTNLDDKYNITQAEIDVNISELEGILLQDSDQIKGDITLLASNDDGKTWYIPSAFSEDRQNWKNLSEESDYIINKIGAKKFRYDFTNSQGHALKWATIIQSDDNGLYNLRRIQADIPQQEIPNLAPPDLMPGGQNGQAGGFEIGMTSSPLMEIQNNSDRNQMLEEDLINAGIITAGNENAKDYFFLKKNYWPTQDPAGTDNFNSDNVIIENLTPEILQVPGQNENHIIRVTDQAGHPSDHLNSVSHIIAGIKVGYGKIKVTFLSPDGGEGRRVLSKKEFGFLVLPDAYLNLDKLNISYTAIKTDEVDGDDDPGTENQGVGTSTYIYRGHNRVIVKLAGANDETKNQLKSSFDAKTLKFNYGTDKNNLDKTAKVYYDTKDSKYYAVLRDLQGGKKDGYDQDGFSDGRMQYYYQFKAGNSDIFLDTERQNTIGDFKTLNRKRTILYYYNWIFDRKYDLNKDYTWKNVQNGGVDFWYNTDITLPGIRFMMLNDRRYKEFNNYLNKKKTTKKLVAWLYKKSLDRIYDDNLYKFADDNGVNYWYRQMTKIRQKDRISKEGAKFAISASIEARNQLQELFASKDEANAEFSYNVVLKRGGDQDGVNYLIDTFKDSQKRMREDLANSFEYNNRLETIEKEGGRKAAIAEIYETLYARPADVAGVDYWAGSNKTIPQIKEDFLKSDEFVNVLK